MSLEELCHASWDTTQWVEALQEQNVQQELCKVLVLQRKEEFGLGTKYKTVQLTIPAGYVIFPSGPAELRATKELPAFISDRWFELHLQPQFCSLYNTFGELKLVCGPHDQVKWWCPMWKPYWNHWNNLLHPICTLSSTLGCSGMKHTAQLLGRIS